MAQDQAAVEAADTVAEIAALLREDPVVVQSALGNGRTAEVDAALTELAGELDVPVYVALVRTPTDVLATDRPNDDLLRKLHAQLDEPGLYVVHTDESIPAVQAYGLPEPDPAVSARTWEIEEEFRELLVERADDLAPPFLENPHVYPSAAGYAALELMTARDPVPDADELFEAMASGPWLAGTRVEPLNYEFSEARSEPLTDVVAGIAAAVIALVVGWRVLRAVAAWRARQADAGEELGSQREARRSMVRVGVARLTDELSRADTSLDAWSLAQENLRAAERLADSDDVLDLIGADVLVRQGRALLLHPGSPYRPCFFDPRHPASKESVRFGGATVPACPRCAELVTRGATPEPLVVPLRGRLRPYYEGTSLWARTGFGGLDDRTAHRVLERSRR